MTFNGVSFYAKFKYKKQENWQQSSLYFCFLKYTEQVNSDEMNFFFF